MTETTESKTLTITLTGRPPVKISVDEWPIVAEATDRRWEGEHEHQATRKAKAAIRVRQHEDGRAIVYGSYSYDTSWSGEWSGERSRAFRAGLVLDPAESFEQVAPRTEFDDEPLTPTRHPFVGGIEDVALELAARVGPDPFGIDLVELGRRCVADLPAQEI